jgi:hypothetical protein
VADSNLSDDNVLEVWLPELWHADSRTGKMQKRRLVNEKKQAEQPTTNTPQEAEQSDPNLATASLLPVEEENDEVDENDDENSLA